MSNSTSGDRTRSESKHKQVAVHSGASVKPRSNGSATNASSGANGSLSYYKTGSSSSSSISKVSKYPKFPIDMYVFFFYSFF